LGTECFVRGFDSRWNMGFDIPALSKVWSVLTGTREQVRRDGYEGLEGTLIDGRFEVIRKIGTGGMGSVYLARQKSMHRDVAIKVLNPDKVNDQDARERFRVEAAAVSRLKSPHTISVYDFGEDERGGLFLVMELLQGRPLSEILERRGSLPIPMALEITDQILDSLSEAHRSGVLHRDLKPENVFVREDSGGSVFVKVLDFGIAKVVGGPMESRTWAGSVFGTPAYMSPEQVMGRELDVRTDLYAVAVVLYEMITGRLPITGETAIEVGIRKVRQRAPSLLQANPSVKCSPEAIAFVAMALEPDRNRRPSSAEDFRKKMREAFRGAAFVERRRADAAGSGRQPAQAASGSTATPVVVSTADSVTAAWKYDGQTVSNAPDSIPAASVAAIWPGHAPEASVKVRTTSPEKPATRPPDQVEALKAASEPLAAFDRRGRARLQRLATARCHYNGQVSQATVANSSASGAFLHSTWLPVVGHRLTVSFVCPGSQVWGISVVAEVVRISSGTGAAGEVRGFAVRWLKMRARGSLSCMSKFLDGMMGIEFRSSLPASTDLSRWEYSFEEGRLV